MLVVQLEPEVEAEVGEPPEEPLVEQVAKLSH
jgi:hypothetical protein